VSEGSGLGVVGERAGSESFDNEDFYPSRREERLFWTREVQEGLPARDGVTTIGVLAKERERAGFDGQAYRKS